MTDTSLSPVHDTGPSADENSVADLLGALDDGDCRAILAATSSEPRSASELSEACDLPLSTTYRKVDMLAEAGLLDERIRFSKSGKHTSEYALAVDEITVSVDAEGLSLCVSGDAESTTSVSVSVSAD
jgi:DNA-binding transcriptional ArsR family regulator